MKNFVSILLGNQLPAEFFAMLFYAILTAFLSLLLHSTSRNVNSSRTPIHFSWSFFVQDNVKRIFTSLVLIYLAIRFTPELFGIELTPFWACVIGFSNDKLAQVLKDKTNILSQKTTLPVILIAMLLSSCGSSKKLTKSTEFAKHDSTSLTSRSVAKVSNTDSAGSTIIKDSSVRSTQHDYERTTTVEDYVMLPEVFVNSPILIKRTVISEKGRQLEQTRSNMSSFLETRVSRKDSSVSAEQSATAISSEKKKVVMEKEIKSLPGNVFVFGLLIINVLAVSVLMLKSLKKK